MNTAYDENLKAEKGFDTVFNCVGEKFNSDFLQKNFPGAISRNGQIFTNEYMQLITSDPSVDGKVKAAKENVFSIGDIALTPLNELKNIPTIKFESPFLAKNIKALAKGLPLEPLPAKMPRMCGLSVGPVYGIQVLN